MGRAKTATMTWNAKQKRWYKKHNGRQYVVSISTLMALYPHDVVSHTKEGTKRAASKWWAAKLNEVDRHPDYDEIQKAISIRQKMARWAQLEDQEEFRLPICQEIETLKRGLEHRTPLETITIKCTPGSFADEEEIILQTWKEDGATRNLSRVGVRQSLALAGIPLDPFCLPLDATYHDSGITADEWRANIDQAEKHDRWVEAKSNNDDLRDLLQMFLDAKNASNGHRRNLTREITRYIVWQEKQIGNSSAQGITSLGLLKFKQYLENDCGMRGTTSQPALKLVKSFIRWLGVMEIIEVPKAILLKSDALTIPKGKITPKTWSDDQVKLIDEAPERTKLFCLLALNMGFYAVDIAHLTQDKVDWKNGAIKSERHKTGEGGAFWFPLWKETFRLLKKFRNENTELVLTTKNDTPLWSDVDGAQKDCIGNDFRTWRKKVPALTGCRYKDLRKTGRSKLDEHDVYGRFAPTYRQESVGSTDDTYYRVPSQKQFTACIKWLGSQYGF